MDLSITWYPGKQNSLILHGEESLAVTEMLINVCKLLTNGERTEGTKLSSNGNGGLLVNVRESNSVSANAVNSINSRETAMTPIVEVLAEMPTQASTNDSKVSSNIRASNIMQGLQNVCRCDVLAADLEGVKLDIVIMQNDIESKIHAANSNSIRDKDEITQLKHELFCAKEKCRQLENDLSILVIGRDKEINEVNNTIVSLENKLKTSEALNESLKEIIMCMNSERVHKSMHMENTSGIIKPESGDQSRLNQPDNNNYNGPEVNYFDPVLENEIKDNANVIRLSEMDNEPSTPLTKHPQLEKHPRNSQKGLNHQNMKLMQKTVLKQGHDPSIAKGQPRNRTRNNAKAENLQLGEKQSKPNEVKDNANVIRLSQTDNEPLTPLTMHPQLEKHSRNSQKGLNHQNTKLIQKTVLKQGHDPPIAKGQPRNCIRNNAKAENLQFGEKQSKSNEIKDNVNVNRPFEADNVPSSPIIMHPQVGKHSRNSQDTANESTYPSKKSIYGNLPLIDFPTEQFPHRPQRIKKSTYSSKESIYGNLPLIDLPREHFPHRPQNHFRRRYRKAPPYRP
jgi:hypothetical protein